MLSSYARRGPRAPTQLTAGPQHPPWAPMAMLGPGPESSTGVQLRGETLGPLSHPWVTATRLRRR